MDNFQYKALSSNGESIEGVLGAENEHDVVQHLHKQGYYPVRITLQTDSTAWSLPEFFKLQPRKAKGLRRKEILALTSDISTLLDAGLDIEHSLRNLLATRADPRMKQLLSSLYQDLQDGKALSTALQKFPEIFDPLYIAVVRSGEASGGLDSAYLRLSEHLEKSQALRNSVISSSIYPAILLGISALSLIFLLSFVIPRFIPMFAESEAALPGLSQFVFGLSRGFQSWWWLIPALMLLFWLLGRNLLRYALVQERTQTFLLQAPLLGTLIKHQVIANFCRTMATLLQNGLNLVEALKLSREAVSHPMFSDELKAAVEQVQSGKRLSHIFTRSRFLSEMVIDLITVGEETGKLPAMFTKTADIYEKETDQQLKRILVFLEPILILGLGLLIALLILSVLLAMLSLNDLII